jgi:RNA polymerase sigma-70 factor (ECF subfamily)
MMSDSELVRLVKGGQPAAYEELVRRWSARVLAVCHARVRSTHMAEELAQETLLRGLRSIGTLEDATKFGPWLCGIASHACLDWLKSAQAKQVSLDSLSNGHAQARLGPDAEQPDETASRADDERKLLAEMAALPENYREVLMLYYYDDVTYEDLAEALGVSTATVNARLTKARAMLRKRLGSLQR